MVPPTNPVSRSPWWFRATVLVAAVPLSSSVVVTADVLGDDTLVHATTGIPATTVLLLQDRWHALLTFGQAGWPAAVTALGCLALALAAVTGRPGLLAPRESRTVLSWLAVGCGVWALGTTLLTTWYQFAGTSGSDDPLRGSATPVTGLFLPQYLVLVGQGVFATAVAGAARLWLGRLTSPDEDGAAAPVAPPVTTPTP